MATNNFPPSLVYFDGKQAIQVKLCPLDRTKGKPIYCSRQGQFFSYCLRRNPHSYLRKRMLREIKPKTNRGQRKAHGPKYPCLGSNYGSPYCHILMALVWSGLEPGQDSHAGRGQRVNRQSPDRKWVVDHINGNIYDWRACNLEWVTVEENIRRAKLLRVLRSVGRDPKQMPITELIAIFEKYEFADPATIMEEDMTRHREW